MFVNANAHMILKQDRCTHMHVHACVYMHACPRACACVCVTRTHTLTPKMRICLHVHNRALFAGELAAECKDVSIDAAIQREMLQKKQPVKQCKAAEGKPVNLEDSTVCIYVYVCVRVYVCGVWCVVCGVVCVVCVWCVCECVCMHACTNRYMRE